MLLMNFFSSVQGLSYADLPKTDAFFLTVAALSVIVPPFLVFFLSPVSRKLRSLFFLATITPILNFRSIRKYTGDKFEEYKKDESTAVKSHPGNFLTLYSGLNMIMDRAASKALGKKISEEASFEEVASILLREKVLTRTGMKKIRFLQWLYRIIVSGGVGSIPPKALNLGIMVLWRTQKEMNNWLSYESN